MKKQAQGLRVAAWESDSNGSFRLLGRRASRERWLALSDPWAGQLVQGPPSVGALTRRGQHACPRHFHPLGLGHRHRQPRRSQSLPSPVVELQLGRHHHRSFVQGQPPVQEEGWGRLRESWRRSSCVVLLGSLPEVEVARGPRREWSRSQGKERGPRLSVFSPHLPPKT